MGNHYKGSTGTSMGGRIIYTKQKAVPCNCYVCSFAKRLSGSLAIQCMQYQEIVGEKVRKKCSYFHRTKVDKRKLPIKEHTGEKKTKKLSSVEWKAIYKKTGKK